MQVLLHMLEGNPSQVLEEVTVLEEAVCSEFAKVSEEPLEEASDADVERGLLKHVSQSSSPKRHLYKRATPTSKKEIVKWLRVIGRFKRLRARLVNHLVVSVVGVHNAGKSTLIEKLFGIQAHGSALERTERPNLYSLSPMDELEDSIQVDVVDLPGTTDERPHVARMTGRNGFPRLPLTRCRAPCGCLDRVYLRPHCRAHSWARA